MGVQAATLEAGSCIWAPWPGCSVVGSASDVLSISRQRWPSVKHLWVSSQRGGSTCEKHRGAGGGRPPHGSQDGVGRWVQLNFFPDHNSKAHSCWRMNSLFDPECHGQEAKEHEGRRRKERGRAREKGEAGGGPGMQGGPRVGVEVPQGGPRRSQSRGGGQGPEGSIRSD